MLLDGEWEFIPGDDPGAAARPIRVPGLWEAQGHLDLDGPAWYRRRFDCPDAAGYHTLRFGAVMDRAQVWLNGRPLGGHVGGYTPFEVDLSGALTAGENELLVRVVDDRYSSPEHLRTAHGKQGWMNDYFPSPPSLYLNYGGIWQSVTLRRHGGVRITDVAVNGDPDDLRVTVTLDSRAGHDLTAHVGVSTLDVTVQREVAVPAGGSIRVEVPVDAHGAARWSPDTPVLHELHVTATGLDADTLLDEARLRIGLRTIRVDGDRLLLNGHPLRVRSALVQGFHPTRLYAEGTRDQIIAEVSAAKQLGLNTLRLHIKAFDPVYLDVCDELGMLVHADIPVAEPIVHAELGSGGTVDRACVQAAIEQVTRDRNHPSLILWSAMNELGVEAPAGFRESPGYAGFARTLHDAITTADPTRPVIENDWVEPDPDHVYVSPIRTAHWYGRLSTRYLDDLAAKTDRYADGRHPLLVSEFGDWGLPATDRPAEQPPPFWWAGDRLAEAIQTLPWPGSVAEFIEGTQRYQGISDRLQGEVLRAHRAVAGWCLTELTDVPQEYNGLWDLDRRPKPAALTEIRRLCQPVLPIVPRRSWTLRAGAPLDLPVVVSRDGGTAPQPATLTARLDGEVLDKRPLSLPQHGTTQPVTVTGTAPVVPGEYELILQVDAGGVMVENSYQVQVVKPVTVVGAYEVAGQIPIETVGARTGNGPLIIGEGALSPHTAARARAVLAAGGDVLVLAQPAANAVWLPIPATAVDIATEWGSTPFLFTTADPGLPGLPGGRVLTTEAMPVVPDTVWSTLDGQPWPARTLIGLYKPYPGQITGTVLGAHPVGPGWLWLCQLPLNHAAGHGEPLALALLADLLSRLRQ